MRHGEPVFVDSGAWIALALARDPLHKRAVEAWADMTKHRARVYSSVLVILETFTLLDRQADRSVALSRKDVLKCVTGLGVLTYTERNAGIIETCRSQEPPQALRYRCIELRPDALARHSVSVHLRSSFRGGGIPTGRLATLRNDTAEYRNSLSRLDSLIGDLIEVLQQF